MKLNDLAILGVAVATATGCAPAKNEYASYELYPVRSGSLAEMEYAPEGTRFSLWAPTADEVRLIEDDERAARKKTPSVTIRQNADRALRSSAARELDIRGLETLEAEGVVENFLSAAVMGKLETVTIIHGKGTGALRKAVREHLRRSRYVKEFRPGAYGEGEDGVTVVTLR